MRAYGYAGGLAPAHQLAGPGTIVFDHMRDLPGLLSGAGAVAVAVAVAVPVCMAPAPPTSPR